MEMESIFFYQQLHLSPPPPPPPPSSGQGGFSHYCPPSATSANIAHGGTVVVTARENPAAPPPREVRVARKDRHSKICTAGGMRDRRMRLSLDVARRFFALQDKLGFDKASKTVQWLLDMSTAGINDLTTSMSISEEGFVLLEDNDHIMMADSAERNKQQRPRNRKSNVAAAAVAAVHVLPDKESRARARERARERTRERNRLRSIQAPASLQVVPGRSSFDHGSYYEQEPWELSGVVFAKARFH